MDENEIKNSATGIIGSTIASSLAPILTPAILIITGLVLVGSLSWFGYYSFNKPLIIDETPVIVSETKKIAQFFTMCQHDEYAIVSSKKASALNHAMNLATGVVSAGWLWQDPKIGDASLTKLVLIAKGHVYAGFDLKDLKDSDLQVSDSGIVVTLKPPVILDVITNPSDFEIFDDEGGWSFEETEKIKSEANQQIKQRAIDRGILEASQKQGIKAITAYMKGLGFKKVTINIVEPVLSH